MDDIHEVVNVRKLWADVAFRIAVVLVVLFVAAILVVSAMLTYQVGRQADENGRLNAEVLDTQELLIDCTTPGGECYQDSQKRTAEAVNGINRGTMTIIVAALACQERVPGGNTDRLLTCVRRALDEAASRP